MTKVFRELVLVFECYTDLYWRNDIVYKLFLSLIYVKRELFDIYKKWIESTSSGCHGDNINRQSDLIFI